MSDQPSLIPSVSGNIIAASAGTGKTYQLTSRFLALLALGADPGAMVALTFTKKAAGEFRNRIFKALADGALNRHGAHDDPKRNPLAVRIMETLSGLRLDASAEPWVLEPAGNPVPLLPEIAGQMSAAEVVRAAWQEHREHPETCVYPEMLCRERLHLPENLTADYFCRLLQQLVHSVNRLTLSTLDSFFQKIVSAHSFSVGVSRVQPVTGEEYEQARRDGIHALLDAMGRCQSAFHELYRDVTGEKLNNMMDKLAEQVNLYAAPYHRMPCAQQWQSAEAFGLAPLAPGSGRLSRDAVDAEAREIAQEAEQLGEVLGRFVKSGLSGLGGKLLRQEFDFSKSLSEWLDFRNPDPEQEELRRRANELIDAVRADTVAALLRKTERMFTLMQQYDLNYRESILSTGRFTFDDITRAAAEVMGRDDCPTEAALDYNQRLRHWMLDEFQDTNAAQMQTLETMLQDALQSGDSRPYEHEGHTYQASQASLLVVGDVKQSIYGFRGGTPEILQKMLPQADGTPADSLWGQVMAFSPLKKSFRSSPVLMGRDGFVNTLFRRLREDAVTCGRPVDAAALGEDFTSHSSAKTEMPGYVNISLLPEGTADETREAAYAEIARLIREEWAEPGEELTALKGDMSVGVLVRSNREVTELYHYLRRELGSRLPLEMVCDHFVALRSPMGGVFMAYFQWLLHPADAHRGAVVMASPLGRRLTEENELRGPALAAAELDRLVRDGYSGTVRLLTARLGEDAGNTRTATEWMQAAQDADAVGLTLEEWLRYIRQLTYTSNPSAKSIQVMTMHKSKGLEFDVVVLPLLSDESIDSTERMKYLTDERGEHIILSPGAEATRCAFPELDDAVERWKAEQRVEEYNLLYVAVSRARRADYILLNGKARPWGTKTRTANKVKIKSYETDKPGNSTASMLLRALGLLAEKPERLHPDEVERVYSSHPLNDHEASQAWYAPLVAAKAAHGAARTAAEPLHGPVAGPCRRRRVSPSHLAEEEPQEEHMGHFAAGGDAAAFGTAVHACFEQVEWLPLRGELQSPDAEARQLVWRALEQPAVRALFTPQPHQAVLREQGLDGIVTRDREEMWVSGTIDRMVLQLNARQDVVAVSVIDFKTDSRRNLSDAALLARHEAQMRAYHDLMAAAYELPPEAVSVTLVSCPKDAPATVLPYPAKTWA